MSIRPLSPRWVQSLAAAAMIAACTTPVLAAAPPAHADATDVSPAAHAFDVTATAFDSVRANPERLKVFLRAFPKGADLHNHLVGAIYAEHLLDWAVQDQLCVNPGTGAIGPARCVPGAHVVAKDGVPAASVIADPALYAREIDTLSMRDFVPQATDRSGHDHFFSTFNLFMPATFVHDADMLADGLNQAGMDHVRYVELMISPQLMGAAGLGASLSVSDDTSFTKAAAALTPRLAPVIKAARDETDRMETGARALMKCDTPEATPGCGVAVRYLYQTVRTLPPGMVFAQLVFGYAMTQADPRFVGVNIVAPEDNPVSMRDYALHMRMFHVLSTQHPSVKLSLHAGELTEGLRDHIRQAVEVAGARRIGHGVDIASETDPAGLMAEMAQRNVMVEINLTSNDEILGVRGAAHPFMSYRAHDVPMALSTDDEGVSRGSLTDEYLRAAQTYPLSYSDLRDLSRNGLEYAFIPGASLWTTAHPFRLAAACATAAPGSEPMTGSCHDLLASSEKARLQWALEGDFARFEQNIAAAHPF